MPVLRHAARMEMRMTGKPNYSLDWVNGMHIGYKPDRIRVDGRGGAVEYGPKPRDKASR